MRCEVVLSEVWVSFCCISVFVISKYVFYISNIQVRFKKASSQNASQSHTAAAAYPRKPRHVL